MWFLSGPNAIVQLLHRINPLESPESCNMVQTPSNRMNPRHICRYMSHKSCNIVQIWTTGLDPQHRLSYKFGLHVHARPQHFVSIANVSIYRSIVQIRANPSYKFTNPAVNILVCIIQTQIRVRNNVYVFAPIFFWDFSVFRKKTIDPKQRWESLGYR